MVLYSHLPVYKTAYDLLLLIFRVVKNFPKEYKHTLGERLKSSVLDLILGIYEINTATHKHDYFLKVRKDLELIKLLLRITKDLRISSLKQFTDMALLVDSLNKQLI